MDKFDRIYRDYRHAPLAFDAERGGYLLDNQHGETYELPGQLFLQYVVDNVESQRRRYP